MCSSDLSEVRVRPPPVTVWREAKPSEKAHSWRAPAGGGRHDAPRPVALQSGGGQARVLDGDDVAGPVAPVGRGGPARRRHAGAQPVGVVGEANARRPVSVAAAGGAPVVAH